MSIAVADRYRAEHARVVDALPGRAAWVRALRQGALERFLDVGWPTPRDEDWKYTSLAAIEKRPFVTAVGGAAAGDVEAAVLTSVAAHARHRLVFVDGRFAPALSALAELPQGAIWTSLAPALERDDEALHAAWSTRADETVVGELNLAFATDGYYLRLAAGVVLDEPLHVVFVATLQDAAIHLRNTILAGPRSGATVVEHYVGLAAATSLTNVVTRVDAGEGASLVHCKVQEEAPGAFHLAGLHAVQARASRVVSHSVALGAALARNDIGTTFAGADCHAALHGLYVVGGRQHVDHHTRIDHARPGGTSREHYRGVLDGRARGVFNGKVIVHEDAQGTDAEQTNHNLLLSRDAEIDTKPQLEIYADDVKCTHGATVGQLDEGQIFYLRSRGVDEAMARSVLTYAFAADVVRRIELPAVREHVARTLLARLPGGLRLEELA